MIARGIVKSLYVFEGSLYAGVALVFEDADPPVIREFGFLTAADVRVGDVVTLTIVPRPTPDQPQRRSTDGPAIEGHMIAVIHDIREKE